MKKLIPVMLIALMMICPAVIFGAADTLNKNNNTIGDGNHTNGGDDLEYNVSPNVEMSVYVTTSDYAMTSANTQTDTDNGKEYGCTSTGSGYAQRTKTKNKGEGPATVTAVDSLPGEGWAWIGGGGS